MATMVAVLGAGEGWDQVWADEFSGSVLNESAWSIDVKAGDSQVRQSQGTRDNVYLEGGHLVLRSQREKSGNWNYTSGAVETQHKLSWKGLTRACVSAKLPGGEGPVPKPGGPDSGCHDPDRILPHRLSCKLVV